MEDKSISYKTSGKEAGVSTLDVSSLQKAAATLAAILVEYKKDDTNIIVRDSVIHRFEYNYELAFKMLKRYLEMTESNSELIHTMSFQDIIRLGNERGLLKSDLKRWKEFREKRNITSHTYDEDKASEVTDVAADFFAEAQFLLDNLQKRTGNDDEAH
jgi:nucleotidyltransferase substrate binding protein (TIGR01987 family)